MGVPAETSGFEASFRMHPRIFDELGNRLITNDVVAVIELVKNCYDAYASQARIRFGVDDKQEKFLEIEDDGCGMSADIINNVWLTVATEYKETHPFVGRGGGKRRVTGEKGLGRLAAARLGDNLQMITQAEASPCWEVNIHWPELLQGNDISQYRVKCIPYSLPSPFRNTGTRLRISKLKSDWERESIEELRDNLSRLISPFAGLNDFAIFLVTPQSEGAEEAQVQSPDFLEYPKYLLKGTTSENGDISYRYRFASSFVTTSREVQDHRNWENIADSQAKQRNPLTQAEKNARCGPFSFEIRAWDVGSDDTQDIADCFGLAKSEIRDAIRAHKGISLYRDNVLVLPKSDNARDWLGLDLRRISRVGARMSTSQIVGYVTISADKNPKIMDTADRESLVDSATTRKFQTLLRAAVEILEQEREQDRIRTEPEEPLQDIFQKLSAEDLLSEILLLTEQNAPASEVVSRVREHKRELDKARQVIENRFIYYSRGATLGSIASKLVHEIRNHTTIVMRFLRMAEEAFGPFSAKILRTFDSAVRSMESLEHLAETFAPLASRSFARGRRNSNLRDHILQSRDMYSKEISKTGVRFILDHVQEIWVAVDPGELDAVLWNLVTNALYWLEHDGNGQRVLAFETHLFNQGRRVHVFVHDSGPGVEEDIRERIFLPGVTKKPNGIGMGLTIASDIVAGYGGQMATVHPGKLGGATFAFDLPVQRK